MTMSHNIANFGDTTLTKVFVGGLAWETQKEVMRDHFEKYGEILEAVIISDKISGRSKGYGFVTFKEAEAAKKACEDATPMINGRRANCNLASLGARRPRSSSTTPQQGSNVGGMPTSAAQTNQVQWYYPMGTPASPFHHHHHHQAIPFHGYGYSPAYIATGTGISHNPKLSYGGGGGGGGGPAAAAAYMNGHYSQMYPGQGMMPAVYHHQPLYQFHRSHTMGVPTHIFPSSPPCMAPNTSCLAVE